MKIHQVFLFIAINTTASEMTIFSIITDEDRHKWL